MVDTELAGKMLAQADADGLSEDHDLRVKAYAFEVAAKGFVSEPPTWDVKAFVGCWARAKKSWCNYTGEPLI